MPVRILIVDPVATNRIVLKVKLMAAYYDVHQAATWAEAREGYLSTPPDLVLFGSGIPLEEAEGIIRKMVPVEDGSRVPVLAILPGDAPADRQRLLKAGADDVMERPLDDLILLARLRSLLRASQAERELRLRDGTRRALGLAEAAQEFEMPPRVALAGHDPVAATRLSTALKRAMPGAAIMSDLQASLQSGNDPAEPDVFVVMISRGRTEDGLGLISNIRARPELRSATVLAIAPAGARQVAASALDQGASDLVRDGVDVDELVLRLRRLAQRKRTADRLRQTVQSGIHAALTDPLTGLYNRRYAIPHLHRMAERCHQSGKNFAIMIADLDHFKQVNDRHGHAAGDAVLVETAERLQTNLRAVDLVARIGGEEFLIAMPETDRDAARAAAERLCGVISGTPFRLSGTPQQITVTASFGVVLGSSADANAPDGISALIDAADRALYGSKSQGRNQCTMARRAA